MVGLVRLVNLVRLGAKDRCLLKSTFFKLILSFLGL